MAEAKKRGRPATKNPVRFELSITKEIRDGLEAKAKEKRRPMNYIVCSILDDALGIKDSVPAPAQLAAEKTSEPRQPSRLDGEGSTAMLNISLQPSLKAAVKTIAKMESRTASNMASLMLRSWIEEYERTHPGVNVWAES